MRSRFCRICRQFHALDSVWPDACLGHFGPVVAAAPFVRVDGMATTWNPADGRTYDSRSAYERAVKAAGCEIVGNDRAFAEPTRPQHRMTDLRPSIRRALEGL